LPAARERARPTTYETNRELMISHPKICLCLPSDFRHHGFMSSLTNAKIRELKARAQLMKPTLKVGHDGLSAAFIAALDEALKHHELVKVKFADFKEQKKELAPQLAAKTGSELIMRVGNVAVLYRAKPVEEKMDEETGD
jgi:RNA-binding protein